MKAKKLHSWRVGPAAARAIQEKLRKRIVLRNPPGRVRLVAGADVAFDPSGRCAIAGVVVYRFPEMQEVERATARRRLTFPYVPGLLSFREAPALLAAFERLRHDPHVIFLDGQGLAHPRRFGLACHIGLVLGCTTIGCAKSLLVGTHAPLARAAESWAPLVDRGETVGAALRTRAGVKPVYVSPGHRATLKRAIALTLAVCDGVRIPRPTRDADQYVAALKRAAP